MQTPFTLPPVLFCAALIGILCAVPVIRGQQIIAPSSTISAASNPSLPPTASLGGSVMSSSTPTPAVSNEGLRWGPSTWRPHVTYRFLYGNGIQASPGAESTTTIHSFSPGLLVEIGKHWTADYTPTWNAYSNSAFRDTVDQSARLNWATQYDGWTLHASQNYNRSDSPLIETGRQTQQTGHATLLNARGQVGRQLALESEARQTLRFADSINTTREWALRELVHWQQAPAQLDAAAGAEYSYIQIDHAPDMSAIQFLSQLTWHPGTQFDLALHAGIENRHINTTDAANVSNPVLSATLRYTPVATTQLSFTASRATTASYFDRQLVESTRWGVALQQRLLKKLQLRAAFDHQESRYRLTGNTDVSARVDKVDAFNLGLQTAFFTRLSVALTYQNSRNSSNATGFGFSSEQVGIELGYRF